jgi:hydroxyacylglutathione hydrolase
MKVASTIKLTLIYSVIYSLIYLFIHKKSHMTSTNTTIVGLPAFDSNYLWLIHNGINAWAVDPGDAAVVQDALDSHQLKLTGILITHHHADHVGGVLALKARYPAATVIGPMSEKIAGLERDALDGANYELTGLEGISTSCIAVPGHTAGHVAYFIESLEGTPRLFCGDTLFAGGCGRLFEGTPAQLHQSLHTLAALPAQTLAYCAHEYTASNLAFASAVEPNNPALAQRIASTAALRAAKQPTVPFVLGQERLTNPFLRASEPEIIASASQHAGLELSDAVDVFTVLREWKNRF